MSRVPHLCPSLTAGCRLASQEADALLHHDESDQTGDARYNRRAKEGGKERVGLDELKCLTFNTKKFLATKRGLLCWH